MDTVRWIIDFEWAQSLEPGGVAVRAMYMAFFAAVLLFALTLKTDYIYEGAPDRSRWRDLRIWAAFVMLIQITIYLVL